MDRRDGRFGPDGAAMKVLLAVALLLLGLGGAAVAQPASIHMAPQAGRIGLVIGVSNYAGPARLTAPANDARLVGDALRNLGFEDPDIVIDPTDIQMREAIERFLARAQGLAERGIETTAIIYFAGHGIVVNRESFLVPANFDAGGGTPTLEIAQRRAIGVQWITQRLADSGARRVLLVIDACRNNPWQAGAPTYPLEPPQSSHPVVQDSAVWLSAARGQAALDRIGDEASSPFAISFTREIGNPVHRTLNDAFAAVSEEVSRRTLNHQQPVPLGLINYRLTATNAEWQRVRSSASRQASAVNAADTIAAVASSGDGQRLALRELVPHFGGEPCPMPANNADPVARYNRYIELYGRPRLEQRAQANQVCEQYLLGISYTRRGQENREAALHWLLTAEANGSPQAVTALSWLYTQPSMGVPDFEAARHWYNVGLERRIGGTIRNLAASYSRGLYGTERNQALAIRYFEQAAGLGNSGAAIQLASIYSNGENGQRDIPKAIIWYQRAADLGESGAFSALANIYFYGDGIAPDQHRAIEIAQAGVRAGSIDAIRWLSYVYEREPGYIDAVRTFEMYRLGAEAGDPPSMIMAGDRLRRGLGVARDVDAAMVLYRRADAAGEPDGAARLSAYYRDTGGADNLRRAVEFANRVLDYARNGEPPEIWPVTFVQAGQLIQLIATMNDAPPIDRTYLRYLARNYGRPTNAAAPANSAGTPGPGPGSMKRFTVPIRCGAATTPYDVYIFDWERAVSPVVSQFAWVERERGCTVPQDVKTSFERLYTIALENNVSFTDLTVYALGAANNQRTNPASSTQAPASH
jgi:uncharacterized protein